MPFEMREKGYTSYDYVMRFSEFSDNKVLPFFNTRGNELEKLISEAKPQIIRSMVIDGGDSKFFIAELAMNFACDCTLELNIPLLEGMGIHIDPDKGVYNLYFKNHYIRKPKMISDLNI